MRLGSTPQQERFRAEARDWLETALSGPFAGLRGVTGLTVTEVKALVLICPAGIVTSTSGGSIAIAWRVCCAVIIRKAERTVSSADGWPSGELARI